MTGAVILWCLFVGALFASGGEDARLSEDLKMTCFYFAVAHWVIAVFVTGVFAWRVA